jgi:hypothetical protein
MNEFSDFKIYGRREAFIKTMNLMGERFKNPTIVEAGTLYQQNRRGWDGDGASTLVFGQYVQKYGGTLYTIDNEESHLEIAKQLTIDYKEHINYICDDSVSALEKFTNEIDCLYLDSGGPRIWRGDPVHTANRHQLKEALAAFDKLHDKSIILSDDYPRKGELAIHFFLYHGWKIIHREIAPHGMYRLEMLLLSK